jgi:hypothetical protein
MKPIHNIGIRFDSDPSPDTFTETYGTIAVSTGTVVYAPEVFMLQNQINHPLADEQLPGHRNERNGDRVCDIFVDNTLVSEGDKVTTLKLVEEDFDQDGLNIDGICYISPLSILLVTKPNGETAMMPGNSFVSRISEDEVTGLGFREDDYGYVPNIGVITHTGHDIYGNSPFKKGDFVLHQGISGQRHILPDGKEHELLPHSLAFAVIGKSILKGAVHGLD